MSDSSRRSEDLLEEPSALSRPRRNRSAHIKPTPSPRRDPEQPVSARRGPEELVNASRRRRVESPKILAAKRRPSSELHENSRVNISLTSRPRRADPRGVHSSERPRGGLPNSVGTSRTPRNPQQTKGVLPNHLEVTRRECGPLQASEETVSGAPLGRETSVLSRHHGSSQLTASEETIDRLKPQVGLAGSLKLATGMRQNSEELVSALAAASSAPVWEQSTRQQPIL